MKLRTISSVFIFLLSLLTLVHAQFPDRPVKGSVLDATGSFISSDEVFQLQSKLKSYQDSTSIEIAVYISSDLGDMEIGDFAIKLGEKWGVGKAQSDNGVLLVVNPETRKMFIATGRGSEGYLTDALSRRIIENILKPGFRANANYKALDEATSAMMSILRGADFSVPEAKKEKKIPTWLMLVIIVVVMIIIMSSKGGNDGGYGKDGKYVNRTWPFWMGGLGGFGGGGSGGSSGGGGWGGFGGGSFGGGGAGGNW